MFSILSDLSEFLCSFNALKSLKLLQNKAKMDSKILGLSIDAPLFSKDNCLNMQKNMIEC